MAEGDQGDKTTAVALAVVRTTEIGTTAAAIGGEESEIEAPKRRRCWGKDCSEKAKVLQRLS